MTEFITTTVEALVGLLVLRIIVAFNRLEVLSVVFFILYLGSGMPPMLLPKLKLFIMLHYTFLGTGIILLYTQGKHAPVLT